MEANKAIESTEKTFKHVDHSIREWLRHCQEKLDGPVSENVQEENEAEQNEFVEEEEEEEWDY